MVFTILFVALFSGAQMIPFVQSQHYMDVLGSYEEDRKYASRHVVLGSLQNTLFSLFIAHGAYAPLTYKIPLAKQPSQQRSSMRMLSLREEPNPRI